MPNLNQYLPRAILIGLQESLLDRTHKEEQLVQKNYFHFQVVLWGLKMNVLVLPIEVPITGPNPPHFDLKHHFILNLNDIIYNNGLKYSLQGKLKTSIIFNGLKYSLQGKS